MSVNPNQNLEIMSTFAIVLHAKKKKKSLRAYHSGTLLIIFKPYDKMCMQVV